MSALFGAGIILPTSGSIANFDIYDYLRHTWKSLEAAEIEGERLVRNPSISVIKDGGFTIITEAKTNKPLLKLNAVAADIWNLCNGANGVDNMVQEITDHFDVEPNAARRDIILTLMAFKRRGLIISS